MEKDWTNYCATNENRNQCSENNCLYFSICKIKDLTEDKTEFLKRILPKIKKDSIALMEKVVDTESYVCGWNECLNKTKKNAKKDGITLIK